MNNDYNGDFKSKEEFESVIGRGCELGFEWKGHEYCIFRQNDDVMNYEIDGERLVDICTKFTVIERTF